MVTTDIIKIPFRITRCGRKSNISITRSKKLSKKRLKIYDEKDWLRGLYKFIDGSSSCKCRPWRVGTRLISILIRMWRTSGIVLNYVFDCLALSTIIWSNMTIFHAVVTFNYGTTEKRIIRLMKTTTKFGRLICNCKGIINLLVNKSQSSFFIFRQGKNSLVYAKRFWCNKESRTGS